MRKPIYLALATALGGCSHWQLSASDLNQVRRPALISRIEDEGGPKCTVFRDDDTYRERLNKLEPKEGDRRLRAKLAAAISRFEVADRIRAITLAHLPKESPWSSAVDPVKVAAVLESFLVEEVPANPPDYDLLRPLGADAVVEFVVEEYGMRSEKGRARAYAEGHARMFLLGGSDIWRKSFRAEGTNSEMDPFQVAKDPELFRRELSGLLDGLAEGFALELNPPERQSRTVLQKTVEQGAPDDVNTAGKSAPHAPAPVPDEELPPPVAPKNP